MNKPALNKSAPARGVARLIAVQSALQVCDKLESLDAVIEKALPKLDPQEHAFYKALSYNCVRWGFYYSPIINGKLKKPFRPKDRNLHFLLVAAMVELDHMSSAPHAVVNEAVKATRRLKRDWAKGVINAVLRDYQRDQAGQPEQILNDKQAAACFPKWMVQQIKTDWPEHMSAILHASQQPPPMTLRVDTQQISRADYQQQLKDAGMASTLCSDSPVGLTLKTPVNVQTLPGFDKGSVSVQDESAQLSALQLNLAANQRVLDGCAAPGGKTAHIMQMMPTLSEVVAVDFEDRLDRFEQNMHRMQLSPTVIALQKPTQNSALASNNWWDGQAFDRILLDVPCSGSGVMRRHPDIKFRRTAQNSLQFATQQRALLDSSWPMLKTGGYLLYTTCSIFALENDQCIDDFVRARSDVQVCELPTKLGLTTTHGRQRLPGAHDGDGFFYALLQKVEPA